MVAGNKGNPKVSVIVPLYNARNYIRSGLKVLGEQTFSDFEIILVDDGSTDGSAGCCEIEAESNPQVRVIHKVNGGAGSARNAGLEIARGQYIYFFDIDDKADASLLAYCVQKMDELNLDMLIFGFRVINASYKDSVDTVSFKTRLIQSNEEFRDCYVDELLLVRYGNGFPWNKCYRKSFLDRYHIRFENQRVQEDEVFNLLAYPYVGRAYISSEVLYSYYIAEKGNSRSRFIPELFDIQVSVREHFEMLKKIWGINNNIKWDDYLQQRFWNGLIVGVVPNLFHPDSPWDDKLRQAELKRISIHPFTKSCLQNMERIQGIENRLYHYFLCTANFWGVKFAYYLFAKLRRLKHVMSVYMVA